MALQNLGQVFLTFQMLKVGTPVIEEARKLVIRYRTGKGLRSADAIHLASWNIYCSVLDEEDRNKEFFLTADRKQFSAFTAEGRLGKLIE